MQTQTLSLNDIEALAFKALTHCGATPDNARYLAQATAMTEADGVASHGLAYIPVYGQHLRCGKVIGDANVVIKTPKPGVVFADAAHGFAHPAIEAGFAALVPAAQSQGIAMLSVTRSYNCGVLGVHTRMLAEQGLLALGFTNAPASIAPSGGRVPVVGTNPISMAVPGDNGPDVLIDQSASVIAKSEVMKHQREGRPLPMGWALDAEGQPTTDPDAALKGSMAPAGDYKGVGLALIVETLAAALSGAALGTQASPFSGTAGGPPGTGQCFIAIDPGVSTAFSERVQTLVSSIRDQGGRVPGDARKSRRAQSESGVAVAQQTLDKISALFEE